MAPKGRNSDVFEELSTVYISGLPEASLQERELKNLVRFMPGFQDCQVNRTTAKNSQPVLLAFVRFDNQPQAYDAIKLLDGLVFDDADPDTKLRASLAKRNFESRPGTQPKLREVPAPRTEVPPLTTWSSGINSFINPIDQPFYPQAHIDPAYMFTQNNLLSHGPNSMLNQMFSYNGSELPVHVFNDRKQTETADDRKRRRTFENGSKGGCDTLCIQGLDRSASERDIEEIYSRHEGYRCFNFVSKGKAPVAFVRFRDIPCADRAMRATQETRVGDSMLKVMFAKRSLEERQAPS